MQSIKTPSDASLRLTQCNVPGTRGTNESESAVLGACVAEMFSSESDICFGSVLWI